MMKIVDCFTFYNELNLLEYRLSILYDIVDYFIIVEANQTHVGVPKPLFFEINKGKFLKFQDKIIHIVVDLPYSKELNVEKNEQWLNEKFQRNCISNGMNKLNMLDDDIVIISDLDEIPDPNTLQLIKEKKIQITLNALNQDLYYYNLNCKVQTLWTHAKILKYSIYKTYNACDDIRFANAGIIENGGWHLSYFGDSEFISNKIKNFAHQEYNNDAYTNIQKIQEKLNKGEGIYSHVNIIHIPISINNYLPPKYNTYLSNFIMF